MDTAPTQTNASHSSAAEGLALVCTPEGVVQRVIGSLEGAQIGDTLCDSVDATSGEACRLFLRSLARGGFARSTPLRIGSRDVHCFGLADGTTASIVAVIDPAAAASIAAAIGDTFAPLAEEIRRTHSTYALYEELALANNELVTAQRELARTVAELQRLNAYKDELLGMAAHDLRNPLNANSAFIHFLLQDTHGFSDENLTLLDRLRTNSDYMVRLVDNMLDFAAIQSGSVRLQLAPASIVEVLHGVVDIMRILADRKNVRVELTVGGVLPRVKLDTVKMSQAVQNLIGNAVQYSPSGAVVDVRVHPCPGGIEIEVEDRGPGIPAEELPQLFKPFTRLSTVTLTRQRSVGLGLAITRRLVEAHGGTIDVRSEVGKGSVFIVRLRAGDEARG